VRRGELFFWKLVCGDEPDVSLFPRLRGKIVSSSYSISSLLLLLLSASL
jgi:hypothetical protein